MPSTTGTKGISAHAESILCNLDHQLDILSKELTNIHQNRNNGNEEEDREEEEGREDREDMDRDEGEDEDEGENEDDEDNFIDITIGDLSQNCRELLELYGIDLPTNYLLTRLRIEGHTWEMSLEKMIVRDVIIIQ